MIGYGRSGILLSIRKPIVAAHWKRGAHVRPNSIAGAVEIRAGADRFAVIALGGIFKHCPERTYLGISSDARLLYSEDDLKERPTINGHPNKQQS
jgi:hypothetical protein